MSFVKKVIALSALCLGFASSFSSLCAAERIEPNQTMMQYGFKNGSIMRATTSGDPNFRPSIGLSTQNRSSGTYLIISLNDPDLHISVSSSSGSGSSSYIKEDQYHYSYKIGQRGWYEVTAWGANGVKSIESIYISSSNDDTDISLSKEYTDGYCYLIIDADDYDGISRVTVNGTTIAFSSSGDRVSYRVYSSGTYNVEVTDYYGNKQSKSLYINVNDNSGDVPSLSLSKDYEDGKYYLVIKADAYDSISRVTVNGSSFSFPSSGGKKDYEVTKTGTYRVVVTTSAGRSRTESLYIDVNEKKNVPPTVSVSENYKVTEPKGWYLIIKAQDDGSITSVTVNGSSVTYDTSKGYALYYVPTDGTYTVVVTDNEGNQTVASTYAAGNAGLVTDNNNVGNGGSSYNNNYNNYYTGSVTSVFKLGSQYWTKNGITQERMGVTARSIHSRVYLPVRYVAYALGIDSGNITWNNYSRTVTIRDGSNTVSLKIGSRIMNVNGNAVTMDAAPTEISGRVLLPISQIYSAFSNRNINLHWDNYNKELTVRS